MQRPVGYGCKDNPECKDPLDADVRTILNAKTLLNAETILDEIAGSTSILNANARTTHDENARTMP